ncbi:hypothetical protein, partial [Xanthomonas euvesicatoria]|uniref:hypothetical protein n=1 Tax=Xanthomonas euvesicatoria TaxID=456327 RepID=UPI003D18EC39
MQLRSPAALRAVCAGIAAVAEHAVFFAMQQRVHHRDIGDIGRCAMGNLPAFSGRQKWSYAVIANFIAGVM